MEQVVNLKTQNVYEDIQTYLQYVNGRSKNTRMAYEKSIKKFFEWKYDLTLEQLHPIHINQTTYKDLIQFQSHLKDELKYQPSTVNNYLAAMQSFFKGMRRIDKEIYPLDLNDLKVDPLKILEQEHTPDLTWEQVDEMIEYVKGLPARQNPETKAALLEFARVVPLRKTAILNLRYEQIHKVHDDLYAIRVTDKGKFREIGINGGLASKLYALRGSYEATGKVFEGVSAKTLERLLNDLCVNIESLEGKHISFHSFKKLSVQEAHAMTGDIEMARQHAGHSSSKTTQIYLKNTELENQPSVHMGREINMDQVNELEKEDWLLIFNRISRSAKYEILREIQS